MSTVSQATEPAQTLLEVLHARAELASLSDPDKPVGLGELPAVAAPTMLGAARVTRAEGFWERHDHGDEILIVLAGTATFTGRRDNDTATVQVSAGDVLRIAPGVAHHADITEPLEVVYLTPATGNDAWTEGPHAHRRH